MPEGPEGPELLLAVGQSTSLAKPQHQDQDQDQDQHQGRRQAKKGWVGVRCDVAPRVLPTAA